MIIGMKKILSACIVAILCHSLHAQETEQAGVTYRYNGKNARTPIGNVYIKSIASPNGVLSNSTDGKFTIILPEPVSKTSSLFLVATGLTMLYVSLI